MHAFRPREKLELIIDSCSMGKKVLRGVDKLIGHTSQSNPRIFQDYRVIIPIQIGAEKEQRIFPDFLDAELRTRKPGYLEQFYKLHADKTEIVETNVSLGFKLIYGSCASALVADNPELAREIVAQANRLSEQYRPILHHRATPTLTDLYAFIERLEAAYQTHYAEFAPKRKSIVHQWGNSGITSRLAQEGILREAEHKSLARHAERFFHTASDTDRLLLQAMYSDRTLHRAIFDEKEFKPYHFNKGERAIESFLFGRDSESHAERVTVIVSEDQGARRSIARLQNQSPNSIVAISSYGLAKALKSLKLIDSLYDVIDLAVIELMKEHRLQTVFKREKGTLISMAHVTEPQIEVKWANRLTQLVRYGQWERDISHEARRARG